MGMPDFDQSRRSGTPNLDKAQVQMLRMLAISGQVVAVGLQVEASQDPSQDSDTSDLSVRLGPLSKPQNLQEIIPLEEKSRLNNYNYPLGLRLRPPFEIPEEEGVIFNLSQLLDSGEEERRARELKRELALRTLEDEAGRARQARDYGFGILNDLDLKRREETTPNLLSMQEIREQNDRALRELEVSEAVDSARNKGLGSVGKLRDAVGRVDYTEASDAIHRFAQAAARDELGLPAEDMDITADPEVLAERRRLAAEQAADLAGYLKRTQARRSQVGNQGTKQIKTLYP